MTRKMNSAAIAALIVGIAYAMPTRQEMSRARPLVAELMAPTMAEYKAKTKTAADVADTSVSFAESAKNEATRFLFLRGAISFYIKGGEYGKAADTVEKLKANVKDITNHKQVDDYLTKVLNGQANDGTGLVYGVGHAIYTLSDPRAVLLKDMAKKLCVDSGAEDDYELCAYIEERTPQLIASMTGVEKPMCGNVDLYSGIVYRCLDIPSDVATPLFATARLSGWTAHRIEELIAGKKLMRPAYINVQDHREFVPIDKR